MRRPSTGGGDRRELTVRIDGMSKTDRFEHRKGEIGIRIQILAWVPQRRGDPRASGQVEEQVVTSAEENMVFKLPRQLTD